MTFGDYSPIISITLNCIVIFILSFRIEYLRTKVKKLEEEIEKIHWWMNN